MAKKKQDDKPVFHCEDCAHATFDTKFENLSVNGEPTLLVCPFSQWRKLFKEIACDNFKHKPIL